MPVVSLPIHPSPERHSSGGPAPAIDRSKPYPSCQFLETGMAFSRRSLNACLVIHHGRGFPHLRDYNGGPIDVEEVLAARARIIAENQQGGHEACRGCRHLVTRKWRQPSHAIGMIFIAHFTRCNIECNYCYLQTQDPQSYADGATPYQILPAIERLIEEGRVSPNVTVDWGGGEPTIYPEFDRVLERIIGFGGTMWVHTNGTRLPKPLTKGLSTKRLHILCSVDAGTALTYKQMKVKDLFEIVWRNLEEYHRLGARVVLKYIMKDENCSDAELRAFLARAVQTGIRDLLLDIDYDYPDPSPAVVNGLRLLYREATARGIYTTFGSCGANFTPEIDVEGRFKGRTVRRSLGDLTLYAKDRLAFARSRFRLARRRLGIQ